MPALFDPMAWLTSKGAIAYLDDAGQVQIFFEAHVRDRDRIRRVARPYLALLRHQLDVPPGDRPRTVQQLIAAGKVRLTAGRYWVAL